MTLAAAVAHELRLDNMRKVTIQQGDDSWVWVPTYQMWYLYDGVMEGQTRTMADMVSTTLSFSYKS